MRVPTPVAAVAVTALVVLASLLGASPVLGAGPAAAATPKQAATPPPGEVMVSVGDSVPRGTQCGCNPFPMLFAHAVAVHTRHPARMVNYAVGGATSASVLHQVTAWSAGSTAATSAVALVMVGANDFEGPFARVLAHQQLATRVYHRVEVQLRLNVIGIIHRLRALQPKIRIVIFDYWNVVEDGRVGRRTYGPWGMRKAVQATAYADAALRDAAVETRATYVSTLREFKGAHGWSDPTSLLAPDGDHPNAWGQQLIARGVYGVDPTG